MAKSEVPPVARRRGVDPDLSGTWENLLLRGTIKQCVDALKKEGAEVLASDVTKVLSGKIAAPKEPKWIALVELAGHDWLFASVIGDVKIEDLIKSVGVRAMLVGHQQVAGADYIRIFDRGEPVVTLEASDEFHFYSKEHPRGWVKEFKGDAEAALDALVRAEDAFVPGFWAMGTKGKLHLQCGQDDVLTKANVKAVAVLALATNQQEALQKMVEKGLRTRDNALVCEALRLGADPHDPYLLDVTLRRCVEAAVSKKGLALLQACIDAGLELNGHKGSNGRPSVVGLLCDSQRPTDASDDALIATFELLKRAGADFDVIGAKSKYNPVTFAVTCGSVKGIQWLEKLGFDPRKADGGRKKPITRAQAEKAYWAWGGSADVFRKQIKRLDAVIAYLSGLDEQKPTAKNAQPTAKKARR